MILLDLQQTSIAALMALLQGEKNPVADQGLLRHMILNSVRTINLKFKADYGRMILACEGRQTWRHAAFPYYKASRKSSREKSTLDWGMIFSTIEEIQDELSRSTSFAVVRIPDAEGDDVIAVLSREPGDHVVISGDKDFVQLGLRQWDHVRKRWITSDDPKRDLKSKIIRGDPGDGVPNILSQDDSFVSKIRQRPITTKNEELWLTQSPDEFCTTEEMRHGWSRNTELIDLSSIPDHVSDAITDRYRQERDKDVDPGALVRYLMDKRLRGLMADAQDFR